MEQTITLMGELVLLPQLVIMMMYLSSIGFSSEVLTLYGDLAIEKLVPKMTKMSLLVATAMGYLVLSIPSRLPNHFALPCFTTWVLSKPLSLTSTLVTTIPIGGLAYE